MPFIYERTIRLAETDAAGIVYFANYLGLCHEAYEAALAAAGLPVQSFLGG
ncbi:MAG: 1,4-dihydroxy-2-naphthoyl-CoA hydrolase, partial [Cephaloticoccus sp.]